MAAAGDGRDRARAGALTFARNARCDTGNMPAVAFPDPLIVAISSRALFDLEDSHALFEREGISAYQAFQRER